MMIACSKEGQLCNRLFHFSRFIANSLEYGHKLRYPFFSEYLQYFNKNLKDDLSKHHIDISTPTRIQCFFYLITKVIPRPLLITPFYRIIRSQNAVNLNDSKLPRDVKSKIVLANGWLFRDPINFQKFQSTLRSLFAFPDQVNNEISGKITQFTNLKNDSVLVGVHIRRGDYDRYLNGKYFYSDDVYLEKMNQIEKLFSQNGKSALFLISSNDRSLNTRSTRLKASHINILDGNEIEDLCALSHCDYLIGPPSSFTMWASFMGEVPLQFIETQDCIIDKKQFHINVG